MIPRRSRGPSRWRRGLRALSAITVAFLVAGAGTTLGLTAAQAAPNAAITVTPLATAATPHGQFDPFDYVIDFSCSGSGGAGCANMEIRVPVSLEPRTGQVEHFDRWGMTATLSNSNAASFTQTWETSGNTRTLVLSARGTINAGVQEALALTITPPTWVGHDVQFTVGEATLTTSNGDQATSNAHTATVTNLPLHAPALAATSGYGSSDGQWVNYTFDPMLNNIITQSGNTHTFGLGDVHTATTPNVTAQYETVELSVQVPAGASLPHTLLGGPYQMTLTGQTLTFSIPAHRLTTDALRFSLRYPAEMTGQDVTLTANRTFVASNGDRFDDDVSITHPLNYAPVPRPELSKCGTGNTPFTGSGLAGMCLPSVALPYEWSRQGAAASAVGGSYSIAMTEMQAGDTVRFTDFLPCLDTPGTATVGDSFVSSELCASPALRITGIRATIASGSGSTVTPLTSGVSYTLVNSDGTITSQSTAATDAFPAAPATGSWHGLTAIVEQLPSSGKVTLVVDVAVMPGVDRDMLLQNSAAAEVIRAATGEHIVYDGSPVGVLRVRDIIPATTRANLTYTAGSDFATVNGTYAVDRVNPADTLPIYMLQLPAGFEPRGGDLASFQARYDGVGARVPLTDHFVVTLVPEDTANNLGPRLLMTPRPGTPAVPTNGGSWAQLGVSGQISPTWGQWNTRQTLLTGVSLTGDAREIAVCTGAATMRTADPLDLDGDGVTGSDPSCENSWSVMLGTPNPAASAVATKAVRDASDASWQTGTEPAQIASGSMEYLIHWRNAGQPTLSDVVLYDLLPTIGDTGATSVTAGIARGSTFRPEFTGVIGTLDPAVQVQFSAAMNPCRPEVLSSNPGCTDDWTADVADLGGNAQVTALRISLPGAQVSGTSHALVFGMSVPTAATTNDLAWNTVAHRAVLAGTPMNPAETARVGAIVPAQVHVAKTLAPNAHGEAEYTVGDTLTYTLEARNVSGAAAQQIVLSDDLSAVLAHASFAGDAEASHGTVSYDADTQTLTWTGDLDVDASVRITYSVLATSPAPDAVFNRVTGTVDGNDTNCVTGDEPGCAVGAFVLGAPAVSIDKVSRNVTEGDPVLAGTSVDWDYRVTNTGTEDLRLNTVSDNRQVTVTCAERILPVGETLVCTGSGPVSGDPSYTNVGTVTAVGVDSDRSVTAADSWTTPVTQLHPELEVVKTADGISEGVELTPNQRVTWQYAVTNTGTDHLTQITVHDDRGVRVDCPVQTDLAPGDTVTCTGSGTVGYAAEYTNVATATGVGVATGTTATATDDWSATLAQQEIGLEIDKVAVGVSETDTVAQHTTIDWEYHVTNPGVEPVAGIRVTDDQGVAVTCPVDALAPGAVMTCTGSGSVGAADSYTNLGTATGTSTLTDRSVSAEDPWNVLVRELAPALSIVKGASNAIGGGSVPADTLVHWNYAVQNTGEESLTDLRVVDDQGVAVVCPVTELAVNAITVCTGSGSVGAGEHYSNTGTATAVGATSGLPATAADVWSTSIETATAGVAITKHGVDVVSGATLPRHSEVTWEYTVTNIGADALADTVVTDDMGVIVSCPSEQLDPGESMVCTGTGSVGTGDSYTNVGQVTATGQATGILVSAEDTWTVQLAELPGTVVVEEPMTPVWPTTPVASTPAVPNQGLAVTGGSWPWALGACGLAALLFGGALVLGSRRRRTAGMSLR